MGLPGKKAINARLSSMSNLPQDLHIFIPSPLLFRPRFHTSHEFVWFGLIFAVLPKMVRTLPALLFEFAPPILDSYSVLGPSGPRDILIN